MTFGAREIQPRVLVQQFQPFPHVAQPHSFMEEAPVPDSLERCRIDPAMPFVRNALVAGLLSSVLFGVLGSVVTVKRIAGLAGAISHAVLGGIGLALYLSAKNIVPGLSPIVGALVFAIISAALIDRWFETS